MERAGCDPGVDRLGTEALGPGQALGHDVHGEEARRPEERGALERHDPHGAEAHDDHGGKPAHSGAAKLVPVPISFLPLSATKAILSATMATSGTFRMAVDPWLADMLMPC